MRPRGGLVRLLPLLVVLVEVVCGFILPTRVPRTNRLLFFSSMEQAEDITTTSGPPQGRKVNTRVREILSLLQERTESITNPRGNNDGKTTKLNKEWTKTRNYLYHRQDLTAAQALQVVQFLEDGKVNSIVEPLLHFAICSRISFFLFV